MKKQIIISLAIFTLLSGCIAQKVGDGLINGAISQYDKHFGKNIKCNNPQTSLSIARETTEDLKLRFELAFGKSGCIDLKNNTSAEYILISTVYTPPAIGHEILDVRIFDKNNKIVELKTYRNYGDLQRHVTAASNDVLKTIIPPHLTNQ